MEEILVQRFKATFNGAPKWAWPYNPPVPLVGKNYQVGKGLLIYASAENLAWLNKRPAIERFQSENAWRRYRLEYEEKGRNSKDFFPNVGIQPMTDGGLFAAGLFVASKFDLQQRTKPRSFLETLAVSNWCKFSIKSAGNTDYIDDVKKLTASLPFVVGELCQLQPKVVLMPKQLWRHPILQAAMRGASPSSEFLSVPQFNAMVVNFHLNKYDRPAARLRRKLKNTTLDSWMENLQRMNKINAWRYIAMLDSLI